MDTGQVQARFSREGPAPQRPRARSFTAVGEEAERMVWAPARRCARPPDSDGVRVTPALAGLRASDVSPRMFFCWVLSKVVMVQKHADTLRLEIRLPLKNGRGPGDTIASVAKVDDFATQHSA